MARAKKSKVKLTELEGQPDPRAPLDSAGLLSACQGVLARLEADLLERAKSSPAVTRALEARYQAEKAAERTAESLAGWTALLATQVAAAWVLSCVFVRTLEDRGLLKQVRLAGPGAEDSQRQFFQLAPSLTERDYLLTVFRELAHHPAAKDLFDTEHSPVWKLSPSAAAVKELLALFRLPNATTPAFRFGQASTRFLGDLYQDLSEEVRKRYALLQTPDFIESFILDRTLEPAIQRFGLDDTTLIDPTCGSGHFLLGAFDRLFEHRLRAEPGIDPRVAAEKALRCVYGADINPYAVAIARFRLTLSFLEKAGYVKLVEAPALPLHLVVADSLLHGARPQQDFEQLEGQSLQRWRVSEVFALDDEQSARTILYRQYAAVVGNPPYITVKDEVLRERYRNMYVSCHRSYSLGAPFCERFFQLARPRGYVGQITANSFMKREFGKRLIEEYLPTVNLELIVNTSGAYIPGHGTPTVLLFGASEERQGSDVLAVLAKRGEPSTPDDPSKGQVWTTIAQHFRDIGFEDEYISVARVGRDSLERHPWSLGGGGASELKELLEERALARLSDRIDELGRSTHTGEDSVFFVDEATAERLGFSRRSFVPLVKGEQVRDWSIAEDEVCLFPYDQVTAQPVAPSAEAELRYYWRYRSVLRDRQDFGQKIESRGLKWFEHSMFFPQRYCRPLGIAFAFVATHNHFALDRGGKIFKQSAPIIKLSHDATEDDHFALLAYLNSSTACFWMKQVFSPKGMHNGSASNATPFLVRFEFDGTKLSRLPLPRGLLGPRRSQYVQLGRRADTLARERAQLNIVNTLDVCADSADLDSVFRDLLRKRRTILSELVGIQEEIDWLVYVDYEFAEESHLLGDGEYEVELGARAFEVGGHRAALADISDWFRWNEIAPMQPSDALATLVAARIAATAQNLGELGVLERGEFKRRWVQPLGKAAQFLETDDKVLERQVVDWISLRLEGHLVRKIDVLSWHQLEPQLNRDFQLLAAYEWSVGRGCISGSLKALVASESVPFLAAARYSLSGLQKHEQWLSTWEQQRAEDRGEAQQMDVPPKYGPEDFEGDTYRLRGSLDVPKERFISYPGCESDNDGEPVYGWAGWEHLQRAKALASLYLNRKDHEGWTAYRLTPMLAGLLELIPWVKQWHNEPSEEFGGLRMGDYYEQFLDGECRLHGLTHDDLRAWRPAKKTRGGAKGATKAKAAKGRDDEATESGDGHGTDEAPAAKKPRRKQQAAAAKEPPSSEEAE